MIDNYHKIYTNNTLFKNKNCKNKKLTDSLKELSVSKQFQGRERVNDIEFGFNSHKRHSTSIASLMQSSKHSDTQLPTESSFGEKTVQYLGP